MLMPIAVDSGRCACCLDSFSVASCSLDFGVAVAVAVADVAAGLLACCMLLVVGLRFCHVALAYQFTCQAARQANSSNLLIYAADQARLQHQLQPGSIASRTHTRLSDGHVLTAARWPFTCILGLNNSIHQRLLAPVVCPGINHFMQQNYGKYRRITTMCVLSSHQQSSTSNGLAIGVRGRIVLVSRAPGIRLRPQATRSSDPIRSSSSA